MTARYDTVGVLTRAGADGRRIAYLDRRWLGPAPDPSTVRAFRVQAGQRVDLIAAVTLGDAELSWQLADANAARRPRELEQPGAVIAVPLQTGLVISGAR